MMGKIKKKPEPSDDIAEDQEQREAVSILTMQPPQSSPTGTEGGPPEAGPSGPEDSEQLGELVASVQHLVRPKADVPDQEAETGEGEVAPSEAAVGEPEKADSDQAQLIEKFRAATKAVRDADLGVLSAQEAACVRHRRRGGIAEDLRPTFRYGQWRKFLKAEGADHNEVDRDRRLAKWLTEAECEKLPILAAEIAIKKIRTAIKEQGGKPLTESRRASLIGDAKKEYENGRLQRARKAGESATVELVDPEPGHCYRHHDGKLYRVLEIRDGTVLAAQAGGLDYQYPKGAPLRTRLAAFCSDVDSEASVEEYEDQMATWRKTIEESRRAKSEVQAHAGGQTPAEPKAQSQSGAEPQAGGQTPAEPQGGGQAGAKPEGATADEPTPQPPAQAKLRDENEAQGDKADEEELLVRGDFRWSLPKGTSNVHDCWTKDDTVIGSINSHSGRWFAVLELGKYGSKEAAMEAVETAWAKLQR